MPGGQGFWPVAGGSASLKMSPAGAWGVGNTTTLLGRHVDLHATPHRVQFALQSGDFFWPINEKVVRLLRIVAEVKERRRRPISARLNLARCREPARSKRGRKLPRARTHGKRSVHAVMNHRLTNLRSRRNPLKY